MSGGTPLRLQGSTMSTDWRSDDMRDHESDDADFGGDGAGSSIAQSRRQRREAAGSELELAPFDPLPTRWDALDPAPDDGVGTGLAVRNFDPAFGDPAFNDPAFNDQAFSDQA